MHGLRTLGPTGQPGRQEPGGRAGQDRQRHHAEDREPVAGPAASGQRVPLGLEGLGLRVEVGDPRPEALVPLVEAPDVGGESLCQLGPDLALGAFDPHEDERRVERRQCSAHRADRHGHWNMLTHEVLEADLPRPDAGSRQRRRGREVAVGVVIGRDDVDLLAGPELGEADGRGLPRSRRLAVLHDLEADLGRLALDRGRGGLPVGDDLGPPAGEGRDGEDEQHGHRGDDGGDPAGHRWLLPVAGRFSGPCSTSTPPGGGRFPAPPPAGQRSRMKSTRSSPSPS